MVYKVKIDASYAINEMIIKTSINEYHNHINRNIIQHSVIAEHRIEYNHDFEQYQNFRRRTSIQ